MQLSLAQMGVAVSYGRRYLAHSLHESRFTVDGKVMVASAHSPEALSEICDAVLRLLAASVVHSVLLYKERYLDGESINAPTLAFLMEHCHSLNALTVMEIVLNEHHCRVLGTYSRPGLEIHLEYCTFTSAETSALAEVLKSNQGPTKLECWDIDNIVLANGLRGNSRLKSFRPRISRDLEVANQELLAFAGAFKENKGLVDWDLSHSCTMSDETWDAVCDSLKTHSTVEVLELRSVFTLDTVAPSVVKSQIQALLDMMKVNMSIHTIHLRARYSEDELFRGSVIPYLETNRLRPRVLAIQKIRSIAYRAKVLGRALLSTRINANSFWMF